MVLICHGWGKTPLPLSSTTRYHAEEVYNMTHRYLSPFWLRVEDEHIAIEGVESLWLACQASSAYHNALAYNAADNASFIREMLEIEEKVSAHMDATSSDTDENDRCTATTTSCMSSFIICNPVAILPNVIILIKTCLTWLFYRT